MSEPRQYWLPLVFVLLACGCAVALFLLASGRWRIGSEVPGLAVGGVLVVLLGWAIGRR